MEDLMNTSVEFEGDQLVIRVPKDFVYATIVYNPDSSIVDPTQAEDFDEHVVLEDFESFSTDLLNAMREEDEVGWSLVNELIYKAAENALESGAQGIDYRD